MTHYPKIIDNGFSQKGVDEGHASQVDRFQVNTESVNWSLTGIDASAFKMDGEFLKFKTIPNYELPLDADKNNIYELTVVATDYDGFSDNKAITVKVADKNDNPLISGPNLKFGSNNSSISIKEEESKFVYDFSSDHLQ